MLVDEAPVYALGRVALLVVNAPVLLEHLGEQRLVGVEDALLGPLPRRFGEKSSLARYFLMTG